MLAVIAQTATGTSNLASTVVALSNNTAAGNSLVVVIGCTSLSAGDVSGITDTQGNIYQKAFAVANGTLGDLEIWYTSNIPSGANTVTVAYTTGVSCAVIVREYYGTVNSNINMLDKNASNTGNSTALSSGNTSPTVQSSELLIGAGLMATGATFTPSGGFVNLTSVNAPLSVSVVMQDLLVTTSGIQTSTINSNVSGQWAAGIVTLLLSPTGTTTSTSSISTTSSSISSTSSSISTSSTSASSTSLSASTSSTSLSASITTMSTSSTSSSISSTSSSSTSASTSLSSTSSSISSTSMSSTSQSSTSSSTSQSSTSSSISSTSSSQSSTSSSISSTSSSSTSSSMSTSTTAIPFNLDYSYQDSLGAVVTKIFNPNSATVWVCPPGVTSVLAEAWGGGGGGGGSLNGSISGANGGGGGGAGYSNKTIAVISGTSYTVSIGSPGAAGTGGASPSAGGTGGDTSFVDSSTLLAKGGVGGNPGTAAATPGTGGAGGAAAGGVGTVRTSGGAGGPGDSTTLQSGGGGGSAGSRGDGTAGTIAGLAGAAGPVLGGRGGAGTNATTGEARAPGGGAGGAISNGPGAAGHTGGGGLVILTYTTIGLPLTNTDDIDPDSAKNYQNVGVDDSDYFIQTGSEYMIQEYKKRWINNTDTPIFTWKGRTTQSTPTSPLLIQIYNQNSATWETLATINKVPADTDMQFTVTQSTNVSNYYDSNNIVTFRVYQLVV